MIIKLFPVSKTVTVTRIDSSKLSSGSETDLPYDLRPLDSIYVIGKRLSPARCLHLARRQHGFRTVVPQTVRTTYQQIVLQLDLSAADFTELEKTEKPVIRFPNRV